MKVALEKSFSQIWGAERWLKTTDCVERADGRFISLPEQSSRQYHRIAVALGGQGKVPIKWGDVGNGFVHVCTEYSMAALFQALDTITDFVDFLHTSEELVRSGIFLLFSGGGIEDLIAFYLQQGRSLDLKAPEGERPSVFILHDDLWRGFVDSVDFEVMQEELKESYVWDNLIEYYTNDLLTDSMIDMHSGQVTNNELAFVTMALQPRTYRAILAASFLEFLQNEELNSAARVVKGNAESAFVFTIGSSENREARIHELALRCLVVRGRFPSVKTVVGIATDQPGTSEIGYSSDIVYIHLPTWTEEDEHNVQGIQKDLGYFQNIIWQK